MTKSAENKLIFLIASFCENKHEWIDVFSSPLPRIPGFPKRDKSIRQGISGLLRKGLLEYKKSKNSVLIRPTEKAFTILSLEYPFYNNFIGKWDGKFRFIAYNISEKERKMRDSVRWILKSYKLGVFQHSVYVSAYDIEKDLYNRLNHQKAKDAVYIVAISVVKENLTKFVDYVWDLKSLEKEYETLESILSVGIKKIKSRRGRVEVFRKSFVTYQKLLSLDPGLPFELIGEKNPHIKARKLFKKLQKLL